MTTRTLLFLSTSFLLLVACKPTNTTPPLVESDDAAAMSSEANEREMTSSAYEEQEQKEKESATKTSSAATSNISSVSATSATVSKKGQYLDYADGVIGNGQTSILFFKANWCPSCKAADKYLTQLYGSQDVPQTVYKVDYDTQKELKQRYGIVYQHTFVFIDGTGKALKTILGPTNDELGVLVQG
ncbi:MAG: thioredoxin family protein [Candidatus Peribacteraceae bacterium]|nr:thioredoxin family protein [Candidatus Peribacteraceae bacterium]